MICNDCGAEITREHADFCPECGQPVVRDSATETEQNVANDGIDIQRESAESAIDFTRIGGGMAIGAMTFVLGYLSTYGALLIIGNPDNVAIVTKDWVALIYYGAHNIPATFGDNETLARDGSTIIFSFLVPILLIVVGMGIKKVYGYQSSRQPFFGATLGYLFSGLLGVLVFRGTTTDGSSTEYSLNLVDTLLFMGPVYPVLLIGGGIFLSFVIWPETGDE